MSIVATRMRQQLPDHFEPEANLDPQQQRQMRAHLEQIDYTAFAANREIIAKATGLLDLSKFQRLAVAAAQARAALVGAAIAASQTGAALTPEQTTQLASLRQAFEELSGAYEGLRRLVARGYAPYTAKPGDKA